MSLKIEVVLCLTEIDLNRLIYITNRKLKIFKTGNRGKLSRIQCKSDKAAFLFYLNFLLPQINT